MVNEILGYDHRDAVKIPKDLMPDLDELDPLI